MLFDDLRTQSLLSFFYGEKPFQESLLHRSTSEENGILTTVYTLSGGLQVTSTLRHFPDCDACEFVHRFENTGTEDTPLIDSLWDCSVQLPLSHEEPAHYTAYQQDCGDATRLYAPSGSTWANDEFSVNIDQLIGNRRLHHIHPGETQTFAASGGRSSENQAPFFDVDHHGTGYIFAVGWTGQWHAAISRGTDSVTLCSGIEDVSFRLHPGESVRTSSAVLLTYSGGRAEAVNRWRRLVRTHFSLIGQPGRDAAGPLCASIWGGMTTDAVLDRIRIIRENRLPYEYIWMDAGWYGADTQPTPDEFEGDWPSHTGDWQVSPAIHPDGLMEVSRAAHEAGMKFLLWFEPERVIRSTPVAQAHPEYFIFPQNKKDPNLLLNLGHPDAWQYIFDTLSDLIEQIGVDCYRQDFNFSPLTYWRSCDEEGRRGLTEIKHITGLYRLWDALLARFPHLLIDNCASGGRRIDIETLRRSVPLWRSDYQCPANYDIASAQSHCLSFSEWMPYSGTGSGRGYDTYRMRSAFAPALTTNHTFSQRDSFGDDPEKLDWLRAALTEYKRVRPYLSEDFYALTEISDRSDVWCAAQYHRPGIADGLVTVFRRSRSPYETAVFPLYGLDPEKTYRISGDDGSVCVLSGRTLTENGLPVSIPSQPSAHLFFYTEIAQNEAY